MSIQTFTINFPGQNNTVVPRIGHLYDPASTLAQIATAGYLNPYIKSQGFSILPTDFIAAVGSDGHQWYKPVIGINGVVTLTVFP
jgi:hypothetical protein